MRIGYVRVSRVDQNPDMQRDALERAGCTKIFEDRVSGVRFDRQGLSQCRARLREGDQLVVWKLDRLGRSMLDTLTIVLDLDRRGISFHSLTESFDTKTAIGRGVLAFIAAVAEDERERIRERTKAGMAAAKMRGRHVGRPRKITPKQLVLARKLMRGGKTCARVAADLNVHASTLRRALDHAPNSSAAHL